VKKTILLSLVIHNHQPVGNFDFVFERACREAYEPMIALVEKHPEVKIALHYTGSLLDWIIVHRHDLIDRLRILAETKQVEILTGGYYEPILVSIPDIDKAGQIKKLNGTIRELFHYNPEGSWLAERVWEPHLAKTFSENGVKYTIVDDTHFKYAGLNEDDLFGYYVTEEQGNKLDVFSTLKHLRYTIPWAEADDVIGWLKQEGDSSGRKLALMGDDGEKFGMWPGTYDHCWGKNAWMDRFFTALKENADAITTITPSEYRKRYSPLGRIYLPTASYDEMTEWVLPVKLSGKFKIVKDRLKRKNDLDALRFLKGGFWRNFMVKYPEINTMHKKMLRVSGKIHSFLDARAGAGSILPADPEKLLLERLWAGQCNCPYWHGVFGGIYLFHIRSAVYENLIEAELLLDRLKDDLKEKQDRKPVCDVVDFDCDDNDEILVETAVQNFYIDPQRGGTCFEWDWREKHFNLLNTLTRKREIYHEELIKAVKEGKIVVEGSKRPENIHTEAVRVKESGLEKRLFYDRQRRASFVDHFISENSDWEDFYKSGYSETGDFASGRYILRKNGEKSEAEDPGNNSTAGNLHDNGAVNSGVEVKLYKHGFVKNASGKIPVKLEKSFIVEDESEYITVIYRITNEGGIKLEANFGVETNWALMGGNAPGSYFDSGSPGGKVMLDTAGECKAADRLSMHVDWLGIDIKCSWNIKASVWWYPVETISNSEGGFERIYQGFCVMPLWRIILMPGEEWKEELRISLY